MVQMTERILSWDSPVASLPLQSPSPLKRYFMEARRPPEQREMQQRVGFIRKKEFAEISIPSLAFVEALEDFQPIHFTIRTTLLYQQSF